MSKIIVPQELEQQIVTLYNQGVTRKGIKEQLKLSFGDTVIKRILVDNNCEIRTNPGAQAGGQKKQMVDIEIQKQIIDLYVNKGYGLNKIVQTLDLPFSFDKVKSILKDNNIHIRNCAEAHAVAEMPDLRKHKINDNYVFESHNGAWILGFVAADGYLPATKGASNKVVIELAEKDREILELIKQELEFTGPIYEYYQPLNGKQFKKVSLSFTSKQIRQQFEKYGIVNNKTFLLDKIPDLPQEYIFDFIRGFIDGDGSIYKHNKGLTMSLTCASEKFLKEIFNYLKDNLPLKYNGSLGRDHNNYVFRFCDYDSNIVCSRLYDNDYLALPRKKQKFNELRKQLPRD